MSMGRTYTFFGFSISYTILNLPLSILYLAFMLLFKNSINGRYNRQGEVKNSTGNGEAKELICMTHGHELRWGNNAGQDTGWRGIKGRKKWTTVTA